MYPIGAVLLLLAHLAVGLTYSDASEHMNDHISEFQEYTRSSLLWAPYRPNCYMGIRPRHVKISPLVLGLLWFDSSDKDSINKIRHFVEPDDHMSKFGWEKYDPRYGGKQVIHDVENNLNITMFFVKSLDGLNWALRVKGQPLNSDGEIPTTASLVTYFNQNGKDIDGESKLIKVKDDSQGNYMFRGKSSELGNYKLEIRRNKGNYHKLDNYDSMEVAPGSDCSKPVHISMKVPDENVWQAKDIFQTLLSESVTKILHDNMENLDKDLLPSVFTLRDLFQFPSDNFHMIQQTFGNSKDTDSFEFDIIYNLDRSKQPITNKNSIDQLISWTIGELDARFNSAFTFAPNEQDDKKKTFAQETLSNLLGGIGYFYGTQKVDRKTNFGDGNFQTGALNQAVEEGPFELFTSVPSKGKFPRGFYWDEGFQLLQIMEYDFDLSAEIIRSWFNLIDENGWIAREVILGDESRSRVPDEFITQNPNIANPPTLLLAFSELLSRAINNAENDYANPDREKVDGLSTSTSQLLEDPKLLLDYARKIYPKLSKHYEWFRNSQRGSFDEYESIMEEAGIWSEAHPDETYRWMGRTATHCLPSGLDDYPRAEVPDIAELHVDALSWVGLMTRSMKQIANVLNEVNDEARFTRIEAAITQNLDTIHWNEEKHCYCDVTVDEEYGDEVVHVCHEGYISLLPFALKLMAKDSPKLIHVLKLMADKSKLYTDYGLRSLSAKDPYFGKDENYWRGPIWMNINYIVLDALRYYYPEVISNTHIEGLNSEQELARKLYHDLRSNLIENIYKVWEQEGYVSENYDEADGHGTGTPYFTGWTALVVNLMGKM